MEGTGTEPNPIPNPNPNPNQQQQQQQQQQQVVLIPGLPNHISSLILTRIPLPYHPRLKQTSKGFLRFFSSPHLLPLRQSLLPHRLLSHLLCIFPQDPSLHSPFLLDPTLLASSPLPPMPIHPSFYSLTNFRALSLGPHLYVLGGSLFDARSFPLHRPTPSPRSFRFDFISHLWSPLPDMITPRGSFAVAAVGTSHIVVAGGGDRHVMYGAGGSRVGSVERYDVERGDWGEMEALPGYRAGCEGFCLKTKQGGEFWVMGGYGGTRTIAGVMPVDEYCRDAVVMDVEKGRWREVGEMWGEGERARLGKVVVVEEDEDEEGTGVYMLDDEGVIFRYNMAMNRWLKESTVPRKTNDGSAFGFVALRGELHVISLLQGVELSEVRRSRQRRRGNVLFMQIYNPREKSWRSLVTRSPFQCAVDFRTAVICTIRV